MMRPRVSHTSDRVRIAALAALLVGAGCTAGTGELGSPCARHSECDGTLQCMAGTCVPRCQRGPDCGDGYACDASGICRAATGQAGDACASETDCSAGLACQIDGDTVADTGYLRATCAAQRLGRPAGATCAGDGECRNGTCALGRCVDLCRQTRDCGAGLSCMDVPRVEAEGALFGGCLPAQGTLTWSIPVSAPAATILFPVPSAARAASLVMSVNDRAQHVGAMRLVPPRGGAPLYERPCVPRPQITCTEQDAIAQHFANTVRHAPLPGQSVLAMPTNPEVELETGAYRVEVASMRANGSTGSAVPSVTAIVRLADAVILDLHLHFLDLADHPCRAAFGGGPLDARVAETETFFQTEFVERLRAIFAGGGVAIGAVTYEDVRDKPELDALDARDAGDLLSLARHAGGINVFFVRTLSPVGLQALGPRPGPAGLAHTRQSGIAIGIDTLCYRSWSQLSRLTAHKIASYMGLYHNVELDPTWRDPLADSNDSPSNLMFYSELGGTELSPMQRDILTRSPVLR